MDPLKVLVVDDHRLFRQGLISLMSTREDLVKVVGEATSAQEAVLMAEKVRPDVILMDIYMPQSDGLQATRELRQLLPEVAIVILTSSDDDEHLYEAIQLGAAGYLLKTLDAEELFDLLECVAHGEVAITRAMATRLLYHLSRTDRGPGANGDELTSREMDVLHLVAKGATNPQIAIQLNITVNTVKVHLRNILSKLNVENRTQAATLAIERGLVNSEG
jgi:two-component system nitrate/nitrite response regulator NarL